MSGRHRKLTKNQVRRRTKRIFFTLETIILLALVVVVCICAGAGKDKFDSLNRVLDDNRRHADSIVVKLDSLDAHVAALHEITETNRSRSKQIATGANIILKARRGLDLKQAAYLASIMYDESEFNSTVEYPFLLALVESESKFNTDAVSPAGAIGLGQLMPKTAEAMARHAGMKFNQNLLTDPRYNIKLSVQYLSRLAKQFQSNVLIAAAYNGGPGGANKYRQWIEGEIGKEEVHAETVAYVETVMQRYYQYRSMLQ